VTGCKPAHLTRRISVSDQNTSDKLSSWLSDFRRPASIHRTIARRSKDAHNSTMAVNLDATADAAPVGDPAKPAPVQALLSMTKPVSTSNAVKRAPSLSELVQTMRSVEPLTNAGAVN
jgi:hypothetical protein